MLCLLIDIHDFSLVRKHNAPKIYHGNFREIVDNFAKF